MADKKVQILYTIKDKASSALSSMGQKMKQMASFIFSPAGLIAGFAAITAIIVKTTRLYGTQEAAIASLNAALKNQNKFTEATTQSLQAHAAALQKVTTFGDEEIIKAQAIFAQFGLEEAQIKKLTEATLDLSVAKGMNLTAAADLVAKSVGSTTNALTRYGVVIEGDINSTERVNMAVENMSKIFGGQAKAAAETFNGQITQLKNVLGDLGEDIGKVLVPYIIEAVKFLKENTIAITENIEKIVAFGVKVKEFWDITQKFNPYVQLKNGINSLKETMSGFLDFNQEHNEKLLEQEKALEEELAARKSAREEYERDKKAKALEKEILENESKLAMDKEHLDLLYQQRLSYEADLDKVEKDKSKKAKDRKKQELKEQEQFKNGLSIISKRFAGEEANTALGLSKKIFDIVQNGAAKTILVQTFQAISRAFAENPFPYSVGVAALMATKGAIQLAGATGVAFADGGVISKPTQALMGEAGTEVVLNQDQIARTLFAVANGQGTLREESDVGTDINQTVTIVLDDGTELAKGIFLKQEDLKRTGEING